MRAVDRTVLRRGGFTLVELVVALTVAGLLLAVAPVALHKLWQSMSYQSTVREMMASLRQARIEAMRSGRPAVFLLDFEQRRFGVEGGRAHEWSSDIEVSATLAEMERRPDGSGGIRFYADGGSTGGLIELRRPNGQGTRLRVEWLLGRVESGALDD
ncbi:MAG: GspH/FimT family pseudopilin [Pseudomonadota bacterium]